MSVMSVILVCINMHHNTLIFSTINKNTDSLKKLFHITPVYPNTWNLVRLHRLHWQISWWSAVHS